jgi:hypothetical protein
MTITSSTFQAQRSLVCCLSWRDARMQTGAGYFAFD